MPTLRYPSTHHHHHHNDTRDKQTLCLLFTCCCNGLLMACVRWLLYGIENEAEGGKEEGSGGQFHGYVFQVQRYHPTLNSLASVSSHALLPNFH